MPFWNGIISNYVDIILLTGYNNMYENICGAYASVRILCHIGGIVRIYQNAANHAIHHFIKEIV